MTKDEELKLAYAKGYADAMNWKTANHLEHLPAAQPLVPSAGPITPAMQEGPTPEQKAQMVSAMQKLAQPNVDANDTSSERVDKTYENVHEQEPVAWKPIETAPKDVMVLVCLPRQMNLVVRAWYNSIHNFWQTDYEGEGGITRPMYFHEGDLWHPIPPIYTTTPQRKPLTDEQREEIAKRWRGRNWTLGDVIDAVEAAHGIKE